jgi:membrane associated rhomboid family serine protease
MGEWIPLLDRHTCEERRLEWWNRRECGAREPRPMADCAMIVLAGGGRTKRVLRLIVLTGEHRRAGAVPRVEVRHSRQRQQEHHERDRPRRRPEPDHSHRDQITIPPGMFPVSDVIPPRATPIVTLVLLALIAVAFTGELWLDAHQVDALVQRWGVVPSSLRWYAFLPAMFLHAGWLHAGANLLALWLFGGNVEDRVGRLRYLLFYVGCGCVSAIAYSVLNPTSTTAMIGASGPLAGVMGAYLVLYPQSRVLTAVFAVVFLDLVELPAIFYLCAWFAAQLFVDVGSIGAPTPPGSVSLLSNVCAFATGAVAGAYLRFGEQTLRRYWRLEGSERGYAPKPLTSSAARESRVRPSQDRS